jgi:hypothetical protein
LPWRSAICVLGILLLAGCPSGRFYTMPLELPPSRANHLGFSLVPLNEQGWVVLQKYPSFLSLSKPGKDPDETFWLRANTMKMSAYASQEAFFEEIRKPGTASSERFRLIAHTARLAPEKGEKCARLHSVTEDRASARKSARADYMFLEGYSLVCVHPKNPSVGVFVGYSQRYYPGSRSASLEADAEAVLGSVTFTDL